MRNQIWFWEPVFDGEEGSTGEGEGSVPEITPEVQKLIDEQVTAKISEAQKATQEKVDEITALQSSVNMNQKERERLETTMKALRQTLMTKEQQAEALIREKDESHQKAITDTEQERDYWKSLFSDTTINSSLLSAAASNDAVNPEQIVAMFRHDVQIVPELNKEGKETGKLVAVMPYKDPKADSKEPVNMPVANVINKLADRDEYANLFKGKGYSGMQKTYWCCRRCR